MQSAIGVSGGVVPFLSSIVTVSLAHFMRNLSWWSAPVCEGRALKLELSLEIYLCGSAGCEAYLTSFILALQSCVGFPEFFPCEYSPGSVSLLLLLAMSGACWRSVLSG